MLLTSVSSLHSVDIPSIPSTTSFSPHPFSLSLPFSNSHSGRLVSTGACNNSTIQIKAKTKGLEVRCSKSEPLKVMISGAPASGKGTQCDLIVQKFGLVHISTGDLLRAEVSSGTEIGKKAKEFMDTGSLVPDEIVTAMVTARIAREDAKENGWLLDGYPRSFAQAQSLEKLDVRPDIFIVLDVPDEVLVDRCVGRRLDPVTGKIYHLKSFPPETEEVRSRLVTRPDDTEEKVKTRIEIYKQNVEAISSAYSHVMKKIDGNHPKEVVFNQIESLLSKVKEDKIKPERACNETAAMVSKFE